MTVSHYHFNVDFDLKLAGKTDISKTLKTSINETVLHGILMGDQGDTVQTALDIPPEFFEYLDSKGIPHPGLSLNSQELKSGLYIPFGWDEQSIHYVKSTPAITRTPHPHYSVIKKVNSKSFSAGIAAELGDTDTREITRDEQLKESSLPLPWLLKALHGNSTNGNKRVPEKSGIPWNWVHEELNGQGRLLQEPFRDRSLDVGTQFYINENGLHENSYHYRLMNTGKGSFGGIFNFSREDNHKWSAEMLPVIQKVAASLHGEGYYGPVNLDSFEYIVDGKKKFRPLVEINARHSMASIYRVLLKKLSGAPFVLWKFFKADSLNLPGSYAQVTRALGEDDFQPETRRGVLFTSPISLGQKLPQKISVAFSADTVTQVNLRVNSFLAKFGSK